MVLTLLWEMVQRGLKGPRVLKVRKGTQALKARRAILGVRELRVTKVKPGHKVLRDFRVPKELVVNFKLAA
jgi:hypothetical protein